MIMYLLWERMPVERLPMCNHSVCWRPPLQVDEPDSGRGKSCTLGGEFREMSIIRQIDQQIASARYAKPNSTSSGESSCGVIAG